MQGGGFFIDQKSRAKLSDGQISISLFLVGNPQAAERDNVIRIDL
jgi:hypothetical protein